MNSNSKLEDLKNMFVNSIKSRSGIDITNPIMMKELTTMFGKSIKYFLFLVGTALFLYYMSTLNIDIFNVSLSYAIVGIGIIGFGLYLVSSKDFDNLKSSMLTVGIGFAIFAILGYLLSTMSNDTINSLNVTFVILISLIVLVGLGIASYIVTDYLKKDPGIIGLIMNILFFVPCMIRDLIDLIRQEMGVTAKNITVMFVIEILLIALYLYAPKIIRLLRTKYSNSLQYSPVPLNVKSSDLLEGSGRKPRILFTKEDASLINSQYKNMNYAVSFWVYLNPPTSGTKTSHTIFNFSGGRPMVKFDGNAKEWVIYYSNSNSKPSPIRIKLNHYQQWMNFTFNYIENRMDLFINGKLEVSHEFTDDIPKPITDVNAEYIYLGETDSILNGAICSVEYFNKPLSDIYIKTNYHSLKHANPPLLSN